jgi:hypothetical protein
MNLMTRIGVMIREGQAQHQPSADPLAHAKIAAAPLAANRGQPVVNTEL